MASGMGMTGVFIKITVMDKATHKLKKVSAALKNVGKVSRQMQKLMLAAGLSLLFTGMAIKRAATMALRSIVTAYKEAMGMTGQFHELTTRLSAAWTFFKFSLMDALMATEWFPALIENVISLVDRFSELSPFAKQALMAILAIGLIGGGAMQLFGQAMLGVLGIIALVNMGMMPILFVIILLGIAAAAMFYIWKTESDTLVKWLKIIAIVLGVIGLIAAVVFGITVGWILVVVAIIIFLAAVIRKNWDKIKEWTEILWNGICDFIAEKVQKIKDFIQGIIDKIKSAIAWFSKLGRKKSSSDSSNSGPSYQHGGYVPTTGPALLHAGEFVLSKDMLRNGMGGGGVNIGDINVSVMGETTDAAQLAQIVSDQIIEEFQRYSTTGGGV